jgi:hypothetical protein
MTNKYMSNKYENKENYPVLEGRKECGFIQCIHQSREGIYQSKEGFCKYQECKGLVIHMNVKVYRAFIPPPIDLDDLDAE